MRGLGRSKRLVGFENRFLTDPELLCDQNLLVLGSEGREFLSKVGLGFRVWGLGLRVSEFEGTIV